MDVIGIGELCLDMVMEVGRIPATDSFVPMLDMSWQGGGKVPTALAALTRLGAEAGIIAITGDDSYGSFCRKDFEKNGIDTSRLIVQEQAATNFCVCLAEQETGPNGPAGK